MVSQSPRNGRLREDVNVAMTRARKKLIMVGDSATLGTHSFYLELLEYVQQKGFYKSAWEEMPH